VRHYQRLPSDESGIYSYTRGTVCFFTGSSLSAETWFWDFGDSNYSAKKNPVHCYEHPGGYFVCLTTTNPCFSEQFCDSISVFPVAIGEHQNQRIRIFPNPATDKLFIDITDDRDQKGEIIINDITGREILRKPVLTSDAIIDVSNFLPGVYVVRFTDGGNNISRKFVKY